MGYTSDFLVYPIQKRVFSSKKHFEEALTPNKLTDDYKNLGEEKYAFFYLHAKFQQNWFSRSGAMAVSSLGLFSILE